MKHPFRSFLLPAERQRVKSGTGFGFNSVQARASGRPSHLEELHMKLEKITSFTINHLELEPGIYVSRIDHYGDTAITTLDLRMTAPNREPVMNTAEMHTIEHLGATFLRNSSEYGDRIVYFGPMGCRTGFYLLLAGEYTSVQVVPLITSMYEFIRDYEGDIPGATTRDCGNYLDQNLGMARFLASHFLEKTLYSIDEKHLVYPD